jgi:hypothetical protein
MDETPITGKPGRLSRRRAWLLLLLVVILAFIFVFVPAYVIVPFKSQSARGVALSFFLKHWSPLATAVAAVLSIALAAYLWRGGRWYGRLTMLIVVAPVFVFYWFARQNHFEWMFNPLPNPAYSSINDANFITDRDMVMSVVINGEAAAYPVRQMGYHHIVQDRVGGIQVVTTY